jgi:hypothetical protein
LECVVGEPTTTIAPTVWQSLTTMSESMELGVQASQGDTASSMRVATKTKQEILEEVSTQVESKMLVTTKMLEMQVLSSV